MLQIAVVTTLQQVEDMASHCCPVGDVFDMIKRYPRILQISLRLHLCTKLAPFPNSLTNILKIQKPFDHKFPLEIKILGCNRNNSWTSIQGCFQCNIPLDDAWMKQQGYEHLESLILWTCPRCVLVVRPSKARGCHHPCHWTNV